MTESERRRDFIFHSIDNARNAHQQWVDSDAPHLTRELEEAFDRAVDDLTEGDIPASCRELCALAVEFKALWESWKDTATPEDRSSFAPSQAFWHAWEVLVNSRIGATPRPPARIEPVSLLRDQKVSDAQICEIYGWKDQDGRLEIWKVQEEIEKPGRHTGGKQFITPAQKEFDAEQQKQKARQKTLSAKTTAKVKEITQAPPESLADLVSSGVSLRQAAIILRRPIGDLVNECEALGLTYQFDYDPLQTARAPQEPALPESESRRLDAIANPQVLNGNGDSTEDEDVDPFSPVSPIVDMQPDNSGGGQGDEVTEEDFDPIDPSIDSLESKVLSLHAEGMKPGEIAAALDGKIKWQTAASIIRKAEGEKLAAR